MARLAVAAAGNAEQNINLINARFQAEALRILRGYDTGVLSNSFYSAADTSGEQRDANADFMWKISAVNVQNITVGRGMATAYGFDIQSEETVHLTATAPSGGTKYLFVYLQWDFSNPVEAEGKIDIHDNGTNASWTPPRQDNLITNPIGVYQMPLYRLAVNTAGNVTGITSWSSLGVTTIEQPLFAKNASKATNAVYADYASGNTAKKLSAHLTSIYDSIENLSTRLANQGFKQASISVLDSNYIDAEKSRIFQSGSVVYGILCMKQPKYESSWGSSINMDEMATIANLNGIVSHIASDTQIGTLSTGSGNAVASTVFYINGTSFKVRKRAQLSAGLNIKTSEVSGSTTFFICSNTGLMLQQQ